MPGESSTGTPPTVQHVDIMDDTREQLRSIDDAFNLPMPRLESGRNEKCKISFHFNISLSPV